MYTSMCMYVSLAEVSVRIADVYLSQVSHALCSISLDLEAACCVAFTSQAWRAVVRLPKSAGTVEV